MSDPSRQYDEAAKRRLAFKDSLGIPDQPIEPRHNVRQNAHPATVAVRIAPFWTWAETPHARALRWLLRRLRVIV